MVYLVEDDSGIRNMMIYTLNASGYEAKGFLDSNEFYKELDKKTPEIILLDIMLPGEDGLSILKNIRKNPNFSNIPIIMTTAKGSEFDKVTGLDMGADDYLVKPFGMMEMVSRVRAVLRRYNREKEDKLIYKDIEILLQEREVFVDGKEINLTLKEFELLKLFIRDKGKVLNRDFLIRSVWGVDFLGESRTVDVHIGTLRNKLKDMGKYIRTIHSVGYKLEE